MRRFAPPYSSFVILIALVAVPFLTGMPGALAQSEPAGRSDGPTRPVKTMAVSVDADIGASRWLLELLKDESRALMGQEFDLEFPADLVISAEGSFERAGAVHDQLLSDPNVDMVIALGVLVSSEMVSRNIFSKPVVAPFVLDPLVEDLPRGTNGGSGIENLSYIEPVFDFAHDVQRFRELVDFRDMAVLGARGVIERLTARMEVGQLFPGLDLELRPVALEGDVAAIVTRLPTTVDAAFLIGPPQNDDSRQRELLEALHGRGIPTFAVAGERGVRAGALAGLTPAEWWPRLMRRCALNMRRILVGDPASEIPIQLTRDETLYINMATARALGISPTFELMSDAELVGNLQREPTRVLDLTEVMREALDNNRDVQVARRELAAGREDISLAWSNLRPQVEATLGYRIIDEDRAAQATAGAQRTLAAGGSFSQVLWSETALANVSVQKSLVRALEGSLREQELDVALEAASAYFDVLSALAVERIRRDNLRFTRSNLERARVRLRLGAASPAEEYRWSSQVAQDQDALVTSIAQRNLAEIELNRVLHLPLEEKLGLADSEDAMEVQRYLDLRFVPYVDDPASLSLLRDYASRAAIESSPELAQIDAALAVQERLLKSETRSFFSPELALTGDLTRTLDSDGSGADLIAISPLDDTSWELQLGLRLPILEGGARLAARAQYSEEIARLLHLRESVEERIEQRVRSTVHLASASYTRIRLTARAQEAGRKNFDLVADAYAQGAVSIIELLDAQTAWFTAQQQAASATFQFLADVMDVERASGQFFVLTTPAERDEIFRQLDAYAARARSESRED